jgi:hypothetical protein
MASLHSGGMTASAETDQSVSQSGSTGRSFAVMAAWYAAALLALAAWLGPELAKPTVEPVRSCTAKALACLQFTTADAIVDLLVPVLLSCLVMSLVTLALMVRWGAKAMAAGTVAAITGWLAGPLVLLLLLEAWLAVAVIINGLTR